MAAENDTKMDGKSLDITKENIAALKQLFPEIVEEGKIDFEKLKTILGEEVDSDDERYNFTWHGKNQAIRMSQTPSMGTLRPCKEESVDWDTTQNLYIEGDNLEVLKLLQKSYFGKVKMIYIDPPYNTGKDFVYPDDYSDNIANYKKITGQVGEENKPLTTNVETNGRYHTNWLNMMYPRLKIARGLLASDGCIFISIDDNEICCLKKICDEIFGEQNFIAQMVIDGTPKNDPLMISTAHEYCLVYVKDYSVAKTKIWGVKNPLYEELINIFDSCNGDYDLVSKSLIQYYKDNDLEDDNISNYKYADDGGIYRIGPIDDPQGSGPKDERKNPRTGFYCATPTRGWSCTIETWNEWVKKNLIVFPDDDSKLPAKKTYITKDQLDVLRAYVKTQTRKDSDMLKKMFDGKKVFLFPKPLSFIEMLIDGCTSENDIVVDFFSGSATTAHAVMNRNSNDDKNRKFILIQIPENLKDGLKRASGNRAKKSIEDAISFCNTMGYPTLLTEIGKERIRRAGNEIRKNQSQTKIDGQKTKVDVGFKVFKLDSSNVKRWNPQEDIRQTLLDYEDNIRSDADRTDLDILYEILLKMGLEFTSKIDTIDLSGTTIYSISSGALMICLDDIKDTTVAEKMISIYKEQNPFVWKVVFKDNGFASDDVKANTRETLKMAGLPEGSFVTL